MRPQLLLATLASVTACISTMSMAAADGVLPAPQLRGALQEVASPPTHPRRRAMRTHHTPPLAALAAANNAARQRPTQNGFNAARQIYSYQPGALFELYTNPNYVSTILLEPGESVSNIAAGDTDNWMVSQAQAEAETGGRTIVLVKPHRAGLRTNLVVITDRRTYLIEASSQAGSAYAAQVAWTYPNAAAPGARAEHLNDRYRIRVLHGRRPAWTPTRVFDDGRRSWIEFPPAIAATDMPPVFIITPEGAEIVNVRIEGRRYALDRLFERAELRLGQRAPIVVRIDRQGGARS